MTNYLITNEQNYIGNHVFNYLREYLCDHPNEFYVYREINDIPKNELYKTIECYSNQIKFDNKLIQFPCAYGQYYCYYDEYQLDYFKDISDEFQKEACYILKLCKYILKLIKKKPYRLYIKFLNKLSTKKDRLNLSI